MFDKKTTYANKYHRLLQLSSKFMIRPITQNSHELFNGAYDNDVKPEAGDVAEKPPAHGLQDVKNEAEELSPGLKVLCMALAMSHVPTPDLVEIENMFAKDHGSLHPLALVQWRYEFQDAITLREKAGKRVNPAGVREPVSIQKVSQMTPTQQAEQLERLHVAAMRKFGNGFKHDSAPKWTEHFKKAQEQKGDKSLESYKGSDICSYCAHHRQHLSLHRPGADSCPHWNNETNAPFMTKAHKNKSRKKGKSKAQVAKVTPKEDEDIETVNLQY